MFHSLLLIPGVLLPFVFPKDCQGLENTEKRFHVESEGSRPGFWYQDHVV